MAPARSLTIAAVRGAIQVRANRAEEIRDATARMLGALLALNRFTRDQIVSAVFTATPDLDADFPAHAARRLGWTDVPLLGAVEIGVPGALPRVVRVLLTVRDVPHKVRLEPVYLDGAELLRPDLPHRGKAASRKVAARGAQVAAERVAQTPKVVAVPRRTVALIGLGQIGGSIGLALGRAGGWRRIGYDLEPRTTRAALAIGAVDEAARTLAAACRSADLAVLATPVDGLPALIARVADALPDKAVVIDTGSARGGISEALERARRRGMRAVGGHPLAGSEGRGIAAARADLFVAAPFVLMPVRGAIPPLARALVRDLGAQPVVVAPREHDRALARTSHLPYVLACALAGIGRIPARRGLAGPGFRSMTRLAASDPRMAGAFVRANAREVRAAWRELAAEMERQLGKLAR
jgi:prephenate dehydrogenase